MNKRWIQALLALTALGLFLTVCYRVVMTPYWNYNGARLMPSFELAHGINYYVLPHEGPVYCSLYGPLISVVYLPATWMATPNRAVVAGAVITALLCFGATAFLHFAPRPRRSSGTDLLAFLTAGFLMCYLEPLKYACFNIHADGPGLACGGMACGALYFSKSGSRAALPVSALFAVLAIFCKQTFLPAPLALLVFVLLSGGRRKALEYLLWVAAAGCAMGGISMLAAGPARLYHCLLWVPARHPWNPPSAISSMIQAMRSFIRLSILVVTLLVGGGIYLLGSGRMERSWLGSLAAQRAAPILLVGIAMLPSAIAGRAKVGGDINSFSLALFFLTCGLTVLLADVAKAAEGGASRLAVVLLAAMLAAPMVSELPLLADLRAKVRDLPQTGQNVAFEYLKRHPGEAYFPWFPVSHLYAEHRFRHYAFGIADRLLAREDVTMADFRAYMPADPRIVAFASDGTPDIFGHDLMSYLPDYRCLETEAELPGWQVYAKEGCK